MTHLSVAFDGNPVLEDISFTVKRGLLVALVGPNGAGKTTLFRSILGLTPMVKGNVSILGEPLERLERVRHRIGYVPQAAALDKGFPVSAFDVVMMGRLSRQKMGRSLSHEDRCAANEALARVGLVREKTMPIGALSGGQQQRVLLARALVRTPELLLMDEPDRGLDAASRRSLYELLRELSDEAQVTVVVASHDLTSALSHADEVLHINNTLISYSHRSEFLSNLRLWGQTGSTFKEGACPS